MCWSPQTRALHLRDALEVGVLASPRAARHPAAATASAAIALDGASERRSPAGSVTKPAARRRSGRSAGRSWPCVFHSNDSPRSREECDLTCDQLVERRALEPAEVPVLRRSRRAASRPSAPAARRAPRARTPPDPAAGRETRRRPRAGRRRPLRSCQGQAHGASSRARRGGVAAHPRPVERRERPRQPHVRRAVGDRRAHPAARAVPDDLAGDRDVACRSARPAAAASPGGS